MRSAAQTTSFYGEIEEIIFRCGGPILCRLPFAAGSIDSNSRTAIAWTQLEDLIVAILRKYNVDFRLVVVQKRYSARDKEVELEETETLVVVAIKQENTSWIAVCLELRKLFISYELPLLNIELIDERAIITRLSHAIEPDHPIVSIWESLEGEIEKILGARDWIILALLRRGTSEDPEQNNVTVTVTIEENSIMDWVAVRDSIVVLLDEQGLQDIAVEIVRGQMSCAASGREVLVPGSWQTATKMGGSIGPRGYEKRSGTLGGFIGLKSATGDWKVYGLTCFHCVLPDKMVMADLTD